MAASSAPSWPNGWGSCPGRERSHGHRGIGCTCRRGYLRDQIIKNNKLILLGYVLRETIMPP
eukprot:scaffold303128_cov37-Tisochrysis_lutea.AAC.3